LIRKGDRSYKRKKKSGNKAEKIKYNKLKHEIHRQLRKAYWQYVVGIVTPEIDERAGNGNCMKRFRTYIKHKIVTPYLRSKQMEYYIQTPKIRPTF